MFVCHPSRNKTGQKFFRSILNFESVILRWVWCTMVAHVGKMTTLSKYCSCRQLVYPLNKRITRTQAASTSRWIMSLDAWLRLNAKRRPAGRTSCRNAGWAAGVVIKHPRRRADVSTTSYTTLLRHYEDNRITPPPPPCHMRILLIQHIYTPSSTYSPSLSVCLSESLWM